MVLIGFFSVLVVVLFFSGTLLMGFMTISSIHPIMKLPYKRFNVFGHLYKNYLLQHFPYYKKLTNEQRKEFEHRLKLFLNDKEFIPRNIDHISDEMKILIAACATQLTFGLKPVSFSNFRKIAVYPTKYFSRFSNKNHHGEVSPDGIIRLAWDAFEKGYNIPYDGYNLGLHEFSHALRLEDAMSIAGDRLFDDTYLAEWHKISMREIQKIRKGKKTFLRRYAVSDPEEFFAVCVEEFFEQPYYFRKELPDIYNALARLLNQDPTKFYRPSYEEENA